MPDVHAAYIGSNDYWGYNSDTFNEENQFFGSSWIVKASNVNDNKISEDNLNRCALYYEIGKTDSHLFTPTTLAYNADADFLLVTGEQGTIGESSRTETRRKAYSLGEKAQRVRSMTDGPDSRGVGRFEVDYIVVSDDSDVANIQSFIEDLNSDEEVEVVEAAAESFEADEASAEEFTAENLNRINPVAIEGAEDIHGAESLSSSEGHLFNMEGADQDYMEDWLNAEGRVIGQDYEGYETGQEAAAEDDANQDYMEDWNADDISHVVHHSEQGAIEVHTISGSTFLADIETGAIMHDSAGFSAEDNEVLNSEDITFLLDDATTEEMGDYKFVDDQTGEDPLAFDPTLAEHTDPIVAAEAENVIEAVQETLYQIPIVKNFELGGWAASAIVVGVAGLTGWWLARK
tara:strand:+ start:813 stop:2024 length:1212 start_codon:yes stop_codon:yes gene_type:complete